MAAEIYLGRRTSRSTTLQCLRWICATLASVSGLNLINFDCPNAPFDVAQNQSLLFASHTLRRKLRKKLATLAPLQRQIEIPTNLRKLK
jgi:hypothetical protein